MLCASRWLVGSSNRRMSGLESSSRQMATRRFSPPLSTAILALRGGHRRASMAWSKKSSICQALQASSFSCILSIFSISESMSAPSSAICMEMSSNSLIMSLVFCSALSKHSKTVSSSMAGSCSR
mmetsp:Transcript_96197/g.276363  ORF Transcript_96197/g.276363 Transcript_96197/m.276363 type:complete len:125 (-) Transcript_96197:252-626(-)